MAYVTLTEDIKADERLKKLVEYTINYFKFIENIYVDMSMRKDGLIVLLKIVHMVSRKKEIVAIEKQSIIESSKIDNILSFMYDNAMKKVIGL